MSTIPLEPSAPSASNAPFDAGLRFEHSWAQALPELGVASAPAHWPEPRLVYFNGPLAARLGWRAGDDDPALLASVWSGQRPLLGASPRAQAYAGHQFGGFAPVLGDGRALLLGEVQGVDSQRYDIALKGSGRTPFSRRGDGRAALAPMLREVLISEALAGLGVPTTRCLAVVTTGETVWRDRPLPGAVLTRVAASHLRIGSLQYCAARGDHAGLQALVDYAIGRHDPDLLEVAAPTRYAHWLARVRDRQIDLISRWLAVGFIHGVMNTDNMTLSGETIDYGPCAFLDYYDESTVYSSIDHQGRYAYGQQARVLVWNLARLAECVLPLLLEPGAALSQQAEHDPALAIANAIIAATPSRFETVHRQRWARKLGLIADETSSADHGPWRAQVLTPAALQALCEPEHALTDDTLRLLQRWQALLAAQAPDFTRAHRGLGEIAQLWASAPQHEPLATGDKASDEPNEAHEKSPASAKHNPPWAQQPETVQRWLRLFAAPAPAWDWLQSWWQAWQARSPRDHWPERAAMMQSINPAVIPRNHQVEFALNALQDRAELAPFEQLLALLQDPYREPEPAAMKALLGGDATEAPDRHTARQHQTFCGT